MTFKQKIHSHYLRLLNDKIQELEKTLQELGESAARDTKSSAGDKHETARAMIQIEQEAIGRQLNKALEQRSQFEKTDIYSNSSQIIKGSLVKTNRGYLFVSIVQGKVVLEDKAVIAISPQSSLGVKLMGLKVNDSAIINGVNYFIEGIL